MSDMICKALGALILLGVDIVPVESCWLDEHSERRADD